MQRCLTSKQLKNAVKWLHKEEAVSMTVRRGSVVFAVTDIGPKIISPTELKKILEKVMSFS